LEKELSWLLNQAPILTPATAQQKMEWKSRQRARMEWDHRMARLKGTEIPAAQFTKKQGLFLVFKMAVISII
jgi:UDP-N-acetylenolpyruvoylglucosamine reductase